jgi:hypothetical protein
MAEDGTPHTPTARPAEDRGPADPDDTAAAEPTAPAVAKRRVRTAKK